MANWRRLQQGLEQFAKPWYRKRALHVFRDEAFSPDGQTRAVAGVEPGILLWDLRQRRPLTSPYALRTSRNMAFTKDGRFLVTRYSDAEVEWWSTDAERWATLLCAIVNRSFTDQEWATYVGGARTATAACERAPR
jgi:hypothetical protein